MRSKHRAVNRTQYKPLISLLNSTECQKLYSSIYVGTCDRPSQLQCASYTLRAGLITPRRLENFCIERKRLIISHNKRFVMFRPWKTASQTVHARLKLYNESPYSDFFYFNQYLNRVVHQHITCAEFTCLPESRLGYLAASFVRNPYDRTYSGFLQLKRDIQQQPSATFPISWIRELVVTQLQENRIQLERANFQFDEWLKLVDESQIYEIGLNSNFPLHPAHYWTHVAGEKVVSFVGRVEHFETDFQDFLLHAGITAPVEPVNANVSNSIQVANDDRSGYKYVSLMSVRSIDKINALFAADFELFGYLKVKF